MTAPAHQEYDFDPHTPSPLESLRRLRADARDAVVALGAQTAAQSLAYVPSAVDEAITTIASSFPRPHAIFVTGSAGGGKSGAAEWQRQEAAFRYSDIVEDATHADGPSLDQADTLASRLACLADDADSRPELPILVAANTGMIVQLAAAWGARGSNYRALTRRLFSSLGLPGAPTEPNGVLPLDIRVLNMDDRPTSGKGGLLRKMLPMLRPAASHRIFDDARCATCEAIAYCPARANATLLATIAAPALDALTSRAAIERGRQDTPRALWDYLSRVALPDSHYGEDGDPCLASQRAHRDSDTWWVITGLLPHTVFAADGDLGRRVAALDPVRAPRRETYEAFAAAGLLPRDDAEPLVELIKGVREEGCDEPALLTAAEALAAGLPESSDEVNWRNAAARTKLGAAVLLGELVPDESAAEQPFLNALAIYGEWQRLEAASEDTSHLIDEMEQSFGHLVSEFARGIARMFGEIHDERTFLPVRNYDPREVSRAFVEFQLDTATAQPALDRAMRANPKGATRIGYRPLAVTLNFQAKIPVEVDLPTFRLLNAALSGLAGGSGDSERTFALRRASEAIARAAADAESVAMLVTEPTSARRYLVTTQAGLSGRMSLRARAVSE
ncbi:hypothetical protein CS378_24465 [Rhodococcus ruber]|uniref:hypothetical protein n=1 Tax=Rhodococcus TaxID=1827 RepID=UPI00029A5CD6|nr:MULTISPECIES: hypothetical protein [Rhodococcus]ATQ31584.1 hypothetical protein CS378_24465 [Rhodococcus ruber]